MTVDSRIALGVQVGDIGKTIAQGLATGERIGTKDIREEILKQQQQAGQLSLEAAQQQQAMAGFKSFSNVIDGLANIPDMSQRAKILAQQSPMLAEAGIPADQLSTIDLSDSGIRNLQASIKPFLNKQQAPAPANVKSFEYFQNVLQSQDTTEDQKKAARIELKLDTPAPTDYQKAMLDFKKEDAELKKLQAQESKEANELKKQKLQSDIQARQAKLQQESQKMIMDAEKDVASFDATLSTVSALANHEGLDAAVGGTSLFPTIPGSRAADFEAKLEQLKGQQFLTEVQKMKGMGALSENEGKKLAAAASSLELSMSEDAFRKELEYIQSTMAKARNKIAGKIPVKNNNTESAPVAADMSDEDLMKSLGL